MTFLLFARFGVSPVRGAFSIASTAAIPSTTRPNAVYCPSSAVEGPVHMKNEVVALSGSSPRAIETMPFTCLVSLNSGSQVAGPASAASGVSGAVAASERTRSESRNRARPGGTPSRRTRRPRAQPQELPHGVRRLVREEFDRDRLRAGVEHRAIRSQFLRRFVDERLGRRVANRDARDLDARGRAGPSSSTGAARKSPAHTSRPSTDATEHGVVDRRARA